MTYVGSHERVAVAPATKLRHRLRVLLELVAIQRITRPCLSGEIEAMHDAGIEERLANRGPPAEAFGRRFRLFLRLDLLSRSRQ